MEQEYKDIIKFLKEELGDCPAVIGISGGKDSTVVAKLLCNAIGNDKVLGVLMPNGIQSDLDDSIEVCSLLDIRYTTVNIGDTYDQILKDLMPIGHYFPRDKHAQVDQNGVYVYQISDKAMTNIAPRIRMTCLYAIAQSVGARVIGTGNASERFIGWFTKWGDGACDINPIAHLTCTEVIALGDYLGLPNHLVHKAPADGLTGKSDEDNFGFTYEELDSALRGLDEGLCLFENIDPKFQKLYKESRHKFASKIMEDLYD
jgi:NAD+ synthetase